MLFVILAITQLVAVLATPEQGKFSATLTTEDQDTIVGFTKTLYRGSTIQLYVTNSNCEPPNGTLSVTWLVRSSSCYGEYTEMTSKNDINVLTKVLNDPEHRQPYGSGFFKKYESESMHCGGDSKSLSDYTSQNWTSYPKGVQTTAAATTATTTVAAGRQKRDKVTDTKGLSSQSSVITIPHEAPYIVIVQVRKTSPFMESFVVSVSADIKTPKGYLSAHEYPLLTFYMIMCILYSLYAVAWLVMSACNFRDLLRVQFWIGGVILLGMIEKAVFYSEYLGVNSTGQSVAGANKFAEVVSAMKRALARMLVIIVSLGFGIVKPRLGPMLHRVIGVGILYFILAVVEALVRTDSPSQDTSSNNVLFASIPLAVIDSIICWWIFMSLMQTMKTLRLRRNVVKLSLYRHFSNTIIFCVVASLAMIFYTFWNRDQCVSNWRELWIDNAFWHILFSIILLVIMILWRPNINSQRYTFSPLIGGDDDDEEAGEPMLSGGATETVKMRGLKNTSDNNHDPASRAEEDLQWIEENIPQTVADAALPAIMDSDEEIMTTKYEMSKME